MLDVRKTAILTAVVQEYITTAQPVGSGHVASEPTVGVSPATVRTEMALLEQEGYLVQPHTSAGRIPTDKGYRYFVDHLTSPGTLDRATIRQVGDFFSAAHGRIEEMMHQTSNLLAALTHNAAVVVAARTEGSAVRNVQIVSLPGGAATVVAVFANGTVENSTIEIIDEVDPLKLNAASAHLSASLDGMLLSAVRVIPPTGDYAVDALCQDAMTSLQALQSVDQMYTGGVSAVADSFEAVDVVRNVLHTLEQQFIVVSLVSDMVNSGMSVAIGVEHGVAPLAACSVVVAPVVVDGEHLGSVGVLGPTRMDYPQALATVDVVSEQLGHRIEEG